MVSKWINVIVKMDCEKECACTIFQWPISSTKYDRCLYNLHIWKQVLNITSNVSILPFFLLRGSRNIFIIFVFIRMQRGSTHTALFLQFCFTGKYDVETASYGSQPRASPAIKSPGLRVVYSKNFLRATFFVFRVTYLEDSYLNNLPVKQIWRKSAVWCSVGIPEGNLKSMGHLATLVSRIFLDVSSLTFLFLQILMLLL